MKRILCALSMGVLLLSGAVSLSAAGVEGAWNLVLLTEVGDRPMPLTLTQSGEEVSASMGDIPLKGSYRDGKLRLSAKDYYVAEAGFKADLVLEGDVAGDTISGRWTFAEYSGTLKGERASSAGAAKADGVWDIVFMTEVGDRPARITLRTNGEKVSGSMGEQSVEGTFRDGTLALKLPKFNSADAGFTADLALQGKVEGDSLQGRWTFGEYSGTAKGSRSAQ